jgi:hypothetical protein
MQSLVEMFLRPRSAHGGAFPRYVKFCRVFASGIKYSGCSHALEKLLQKEIDKSWSFAVLGKVRVKPKAPQMLQEARIRDLVKFFSLACNLDTDCLAFGRTLSLILDSCREIIHLLMYQFEDEEFIQVANSLFSMQFKENGRTLRARLNNLGTTCLHGITFQCSRREWNSSKESYLIFPDKRVEDKFPGVLTG